MVWEGGIGVDQALDELRLVGFVLGYIDPVLQGSMPADVCCGDVGKEELKVADYAVLVAGLGSTNAAAVRAACGEHVARWAVRGALNCLAHEVELSCCYHVFDVGNAIEDVSDLLILYMLISDFGHGDVKDVAYAPMKEDFKFGQKALL
jgi:hypothetical protein